MTRTASQQALSHAVCIGNVGREIKAAIRHLREFRADRAHVGYAVLHLEAALKDIKERTEE